MAGAKRKHDAISEEMQLSSKKFRQHASSDQAKLLALTSSAPATPPAQQEAPSLEILPGEILRQILYISYEPSLIHTCRSLYQSLPGYVAYTTSLALLAFTPKRQPWTRTSLPTLNLPVPELAQFVDLDQLQLQLKTCKSLWLTPAILQATHLTLLEHFISAIIFSPAIFICSSQREAMEEALRTLKHDYCYRNSKLPWLTSRHCPGNNCMLSWLTSRQCPGKSLNGISIAIDGLRVKVETNPCTNLPFTGEWFYLFETEIIPDCLLRNPTDATADAVIEILVSSYPHSWTLSCSHHLMQQAILKVLGDSGTPQDGTHINPDGTFYDLMSLNEACTLPAPLTAEMLALPIQSDILRRLLDSHKSHAGDDQSQGYSIDDMLRLELGLHQYQRECYDLITERIAWIMKDDSANWQDVAQSLGFESVRELKITRRVVHAMFCSDTKATAVDQDEDGCGPASHYCRHWY